MLYSALQETGDERDQNDEIECCSISFRDGGGGSPVEVEEGRGKVGKRRISSTDADIQ